MIGLDRPAVEPAAGRSLSERTLYFHPAINLARVEIF